jgi:hypothetical protein
MDASEPGFRCGCGAIHTDPGGPFKAACVDRNSACDLDKPCDGHADCPAGSVCLVGCKDLPDLTGAEGRRCSTPCDAA